MNSIIVEANCLYYSRHYFSAPSGWKDQWGEVFSWGVEGWRRQINMSDISSKEQVILCILSLVS